MFGMMEAMLSFLRRQVGLRTDAASSTGSLHAKVRKITNDLSSLVSDGVYLATTVASDTVRFSVDTEVSVTSETYALVRRVAINISGQMRVKFSLQKTGSGSGRVYGRVYRNGEPVGTECSVSTASTVEFTEDLFFGSGDYIELWAKVSTTKPDAWVSGFKVCFDYAAFYPGAVIM